MRPYAPGLFSEIEIVGDVEAAEENWNFNTGDNFASRVGKMFWFGPFRWVEKLMFHTPIVYAFILASALYHDRIWYPTYGRKLVNNWLESSHWGRLFSDYRPG